jgi:hypothetical protein
MESKVGHAPDLADIGYHKLLIQLDWGEPNGTI